MKILGAALALIALSALASAASCAYDPNQSLFDLINCQTGTIIPMLVMLSVFIIGIIYSAGNFMGRAEWIILAKDELSHLFFSVILLISFGGIVWFFSGLTDATFHSAKDSMGLTGDRCINIDGLAPMSTCYMDRMMKDSEGIIQQYSEQHVKQLLKASEYVSYYGLVQGTTYSPYAYRRTWSMMYDNMNTMFVLPAYMSIKAQWIFVTYFMGNDTEGASSAALLTLILPGAFLLRFLPVLRSTGNFLIAFSLGFYTLMPFLIALNGIMYSVLFTNCHDYEPIISDAVLGGCSSTGNFFSVAVLYPQAFLLPNVMITVIVAYVVSINKALRVFG